MVPTEFMTEVYGPSASDPNVREMWTLAPTHCHCEFIMLVAEVRVEVTTTEQSTSYFQGIYNTRLLYKGLR